MIRSIKFLFYIYSVDKAVGGNVALHCPHIQYICT